MGRFPQAGILWEQGNKVGGLNWTFQLPKNSGIFPKISLLSTVIPSTEFLSFFVPIPDSPGIFSGDSQGWGFLGWLKGPGPSTGPPPTWSCCHHPRPFGATKEFLGFFHLLSQIPDTAPLPVPIPGWISQFWEYFPNPQRSLKHQDLLSFTKGGQRTQPQQKMLPLQSKNDSRIPDVEFLEQLQTEIPTGYRTLPSH